MSAKDLPEPCHTPLVWREEGDRVALPVDVEGVGPTGEWVRVPRDFFLEAVLLAARQGCDPQAMVSWAINRVILLADEERIKTAVAFRRIIEQMGKD